MPATFEDAFERVKELAATFKANETFYLSPQYQEAEARRDFVDKFLIALGWDVNHDAQNNPYEQEVKVERKEHGVSQRRADYAFYLAPHFRDVKFYIEAKKPFGEIATPDNYFQTIRYGWGSKTPVAALFDFEQFEIVDCRFKPDLETALQRNLKKFHFSQYADKEKFAEIYWLFSREAVAGGALEKFAETLPKKRGAVQRGLLKGGDQNIDDSFLEELDAHRDALAHIFKNYNPKLDGEALTEATQRTIDRLVFIRFLEDKLIEPQYLVAKFGERGSVWGDFIATSRRLDGIYNGIVFKKNDILDSPTFKVDDEQFSGICKALCHVNSPYDFNAIPIHILGSIYERFLGKVIVATDKRARVEEKPEVRKAGGVYYTPEYIVRYIVENTVGRLIEGKTPAQIAEMKFADIACGSGSFLLGVYDLLIRHHTKFYNENPGKSKKGETVLREDGLHLSLQKKRDILLNNIYGVDIDNQAVEVAQLSLYLKLLQDETPGSARQYFLDFEQQALLPSLSKNIVCGNSLIGTDVLSGELFEPVEERKLNPMDYDQRFPEIIKRGGFDAIVGNPPYVRQETLSNIKGYLESHYQSFDGIADLYAYFMEKSLSLLKSGGLFSYIVSSSFLRATYGEPLRRHLKTVGTVLQMVDFGGLPVFANAKDTYVCIPLITKGVKKPMPRIEVCKIPSLKISNLTPYVAEQSFTIPPERFSAATWALKSDAEAAVFEKITKAGKPLGEYIERKMFYGLKTGFNDAFVITTEQRQGIIKKSSTSAPLIKPFLGGEDIRRYHIEDNGKLMIVIPCGWTRTEIAKTKKGSISEKQAWEWLNQNHSGIAKHLEQFEDALRKRQDQGDFFWELRPCDYYSSLDAPKIIFPDICKAPRFYIDREGIYLANTAYCLGSDSLYLLGLLNSRLFWFAISNISIPFGIRAGEYRYRLIYQYMEQVPIRPIDLKKAADKARHDELVSLVEQMLATKPQLARAQSDKDKDFYENKCATLNRHIDALVYELYGLTADEIKIVEGTT
jgi:type I restriction-modification system DNA methylase subunit